MTTPDYTARSDSALGGHTALPWQALAPDEVDVFVPIIGVRLDENGEPLETPTNGLVGGATLFPTEIDAEDYERAKANAAFIVRAANSHYELLEALIEILGPLNVCSDNPHVRDDQVLPVDMTMGELRKARAAIAKATPQNHLQHKG